MRWRNCLVRASDARPAPARGAGLQHHPGLDEEHLVGHLLGEPDLVRDDHHRPAFRSQILDHPQQVSPFFQLYLARSHTAVAVRPTSIAAQASGLRGK
jgi:hypothetical protein